MSLHLFFIAAIVAFEFISCEISVVSFDYIDSYDNSEHSSWAYFDNNVEPKGLETKEKK